MGLSLGFGFRARLRLLVRVVIGDFVNLDNIIVAP